ncbi:uncharacterized protein BO88DRAFT_429996 [Aspergillus vadensis CBS 113365]|uniref:Uncharacterized protein n=1 Tax=Aspergillus vadensis (strain CBS 113365 / IMI 142717 / IBT 24658) TaxID=1448311 RepID=A0A319AW95_ASPVC|nr:hypothetical protein BO88DRAFT_429996 [Aspergillus vadensis CBS 113365]PYH63995.1 hypothetical protein BO88DRAFT_429996 [Aspergillus vadensis CBS 113365]
MPVEAVGRPYSYTSFLTTSAIQILPRRDVRGTVWFGRTRPPVVSTQHAATSTTSDYVPSNQAFIQVYEPRACIYYARMVVLARHRKNIANLVHIQMQAVERPAIKIYIQIINRLAHHSIPRLLDIFQYTEQYLLMWESFKCTLHEALALSCRIIKKEIFRCLQFLRGQSKELASLTPRDILFTEEGEIKISIAGIKNSHQINQVDPSRIDAMATTFNALRSILDKIMQKIGSNFTWSQEIQSFKSALAQSTSAQCLDKLVQQVTGEGGLKVLVELANKTIFHEISFPPEDFLAKTGPLGKPVELSTT